jgi:hypothetical protein
MELTTFPTFPPLGELTLEAVGLVRFSSCFADNISTQKMLIGLFSGVEDKLLKAKELP